MSEIILDDSVADDDVAEHNLVLVAGHKGCHAADANYKSELNVGKAGTAVGRDGRGANLAYARHVRKHDIMAADVAGGVGVGIPRGFVVGGAFVVLVDVEESLDGVGLDGKGADDGNLKVATAGRACYLSYGCGYWVKIEMVS